jgi:hypothetical protein
MHREEKTSMSVITRSLSLTSRRIRRIKQKKKTHLIDWNYRNSRWKMNNSENRYSSSHQATSPHQDQQTATQPTAK